MKKNIKTRADELYEIAKTGGIPTLHGTQCTECCFILWGEHTEMVRVCENCGRTVSYNVQWPYPTGDNYWKVLWGFYRSALLEFENSTHVGTNYWGVPREAIATIIFSKTYQEAMIQEVIRDIAIIYGCKGPNKTTELAENELKSIYLTITGKDLLKEANIIAIPGYRGALADLTRNRNDIIHNNKIVDAGLDAIKFAVAVACESAFMACQLINKEAKINRGK
jgi:hypothetical protein